MGRSALRSVVVVAAMVAAVWAGDARAENLSLPGEVWTELGWKQTETQYLPGVVHSESGWVPVSWYSGGTNAKRQEALMAQAVAARTYLLRYLNANGMSAKIPIGPQFQAWTSQYANHSSAAAADSAGVVMTWSGWVITANYASGAWPVNGQGWPFAPAEYGVDQNGSKPGLTWPEVKSLYVGKSLSDKGDGYSWTWCLVTVNEGKTGSAVIETPQSLSGNRNRGSLGQYRSLWLAHVEGRKAPDILRYWYGADVTIEGWGGGGAPAPPPDDPAPPPPVDPGPPGVPTGLTPASGTSVSTSSVTLAWQGVAGAAVYQLDMQYLNAGSWTWYWTWDQGGTSKKVWPQVDPSTYRWRVRAKSGAGGWGGWSSWSTFGYATAAPPPPPAEPEPEPEPDPVPAAPTGLSPNGAGTLTTDSVALSWQKVSGVLGYQVEIEYAKSGAWSWYYTYAVGGANSGITFWPQVDPASYRWRVRGENAAGWGGWSSWATFGYATAPQGPAPPAAPAGLAPDDTTETGDAVTLSWGAVTGATSGYEVDLDVWTAAGWAAYDTVLPSGPTATFWPQVSPASFRWRVRAEGDGGVGPWSLFVSFDYAPPTAPAVPTGLAPASGTQTGDSVALSWGAVAAASGYDVEADYWTGSGWSHYQTWAVTGAGWTFWPQVDPTSYRWRVRSKGAGGTSGWSLWVQFAYASAGAAPSAPTGLSPSGGTLTTESVTLSWNGVTGASAYQVEIDWWKAGAWADYYTYDPAGTSATFWPQVDPGSYRWRVRAQYPGGWTAWSSWVQFAYDTGGGGEDVVPSGLWPAGGVAMTDPSVTMSWDVVAGAAGYEVAIQWQDGGTWKDYYTYDVSPSAASKTFWPQVDPALYRWRVRAQTSAGMGGWSGWAEFWFDD